jgi:hypothetical protein
MALVAALLALPAHATAADCKALDKKIAVAKTAAQHEAIAACYAAKAKAAEASANEHKKLSEAYQTLVGAPVGKLQIYCESFTRTFLAEAKTYGQMADAHRELAKSAK